MLSKINLPSPWAEFLSEVDQSLSASVEIHCLGGFVLTLLYAVPRTTSDLDYVSAVPDAASEELMRIGGAGSNLANKHKVHFQYVGIADLPDDYESRLTTLNLGLRRLTVKILDPYDLVLSKLTRNSPKDSEDVKALAARLKLSFRMLTTRFDAEMKPWIPNLERPQLTLKLWSEYFAE
jgi:hypothetical protein